MVVVTGLVCSNYGAGVMLSMAAAVTTYDITELPYGPVTSSRAEYTSRAADVTRKPAGSITSQRERY